MKSVSDLELIFELHFDKIYKFFYFKTLSKEIAEDLTSETFLAFADKLKKEDIEDEKKYIYGIAKIIFTKYLRTKYKENNVNFSDSEQFENYVEKVNEAKSINLEDVALKFIDMLPLKQQEVIRLRLIEKASLSEIAQRLGKNMNYVKTTQKRGLKSLKKLIACTP